MSMCSPGNCGFGPWSCSGRDVQCSPAQVMLQDCQIVKIPTTKSRMLYRLQEQELQQVQRGWSAASQQEGSHSQEAQRAKQQVKALEGQLRDLHSRLTTLQADAR